MVISWAAGSPSMALRSEEKVTSQTDLGSDQTQIHATLDQPRRDTKVRQDKTPVDPSRPLGLHSAVDRGTHARAALGNSHPHALQGRRRQAEKAVLALGGTILVPSQHTMSQHPQRVAAELIPKESLRVMV